MPFVIFGMNVQPQASQLQAGREFSNLKNWSWESVRICKIVLVLHQFLLSCCVQRSQQCLCERQGTDHGSVLFWSDLAGCKCGQKNGQLLKVQWLQRASLGLSRVLARVGLQTMRTRLFPPCEGARKLSHSQDSDSGTMLRVQSRSNCKLSFLCECECQTSEWWTCYE